MKFVSFPSIESFHNVVKYCEMCLTDSKPKVPYRGKIKLHGTNAGVQFGADGEIAAQSRSQFIVPGDDNAGFAQWVEKNRAYFESLSLSNHTVFGEWCGQGIMKGTAINQIGRKIFAVFAIMDSVNNTVIIDPVAISGILEPDVLVPADMHVLPWCSATFEVDFNDRDQLLATVEKLNLAVEAVEFVDPWVEVMFGVNGVGEGIVYYPTRGMLAVNKEAFENFVFKAKGEKHKVVKTKEAVQIDPEVASSVDSFVKMFLTDARLEQGLALTTADMKNTGTFLKWVMSDVQKESTAELEASDLTWEQVNKDVQTAARNWFRVKCTAI